MLFRPAAFRGLTLVNVLCFKMYKEVVESVWERSMTVINLLPGLTDRHYLDSLPHPSGIPSVTEVHFFPHRPVSLP